jgi:hypothetical protein
MSDISRGSNERSLGELFGELAREITTLFRQEINLARTEMTHKAARAARNAGMLLAGGAVAYAGVLAILAGVITLIARAGLPFWAAALIVGVIVAAGGAAIAMKGLNALRSEDLAPQETIETIKEDATWIQAQTRQRG